MTPAQIAEAQKLAREWKPTPASTIGTHVFAVPKDGKRRRSCNGRGPPLVRSPPRGASWRCPGGGSAGRILVPAADRSQE
jgi:hypothetical protein